MKKKPEHYRAVGDYESPYPCLIVFQKGEKAKIGQEFKEDPVWVWGKVLSNNRFRSCRKVMAKRMKRLRRR